MRRVSKKIDQLIKRIEQLFQRKPFFGTKIILGLGLLTLFIVQGFLHVIILFFLSPTDSFIHFYPVVPGKGYTGSFIEHRRWLRRLRTASSAAFAFVCVLTTVINILFITAQPVYAVVKTWDGGGADNNWSTCGNWNNDTCPGTGDVATFDATSTKNVTIDGTSLTIAGIDINSGYTGIITMAAGLTLNVGTSNFDMADGTFTGASGDTLDTNSDIIISGGTFNAPGTMRVADDWTHTAGGTVNHQNGTVTFDAAVDGTFDFDPAVAGATSGKFYNVTVHKTTNWLAQVNTSDVMIVENDLTLKDGRFNAISGGSADVRGDMVVESAMDGTTTAVKFTGSAVEQTIDLTGATDKFDADLAIDKSAGTFKLLSDATLTAAGQDLTLTNGTFDPNSKTIQVAGNFSQSNGIYLGTGTLDLNLDFTLTGGTFNLPSTLTVTDDWTHTGGTFTHNNRNVTFDGGVDTLIDIDSTVTTSGIFYDFTMNKTTNWIVSVNSSEAIVVENTLTLTDGRLRGGDASSNVQAKKNVVVGSGVDDSTLLLKFVDSSNQNFDLTGGEANYNGDITVDKSGGTLTLLSDLTMNAIGQDLSLVNGTFDQNGKNVAMGSLVQSGGTYTGGVGTLDLGADFTLSAGTFNAPSAIEITDDWNHVDGGTFNHLNGTVTFVDGVDSTIDLAGIATSGLFYNLTMNKANNWLMRVNTGDTIITEGTLTLTDGRFNAITLTDGTMNAKGDVVVASTIEDSATNLNFSGSAVQTFNLTGAAGLYQNDISINKTGGQVNLASALTLDNANQDLTLIEGTLNLNGNNLAVNGTSSKLVIQDGGNLSLQRDETITANTNYPQLDSGSTVTYTATSGSGNIKDYSYHHLTINGTGGSFTLGSGEILAGDLKVTAGTFDANNQTLSINGNTTINGGAFKTGTNTITFGNASGDAVTISSGALEIQSDDTTVDIVKTANTWTNSGGTIHYSAATGVTTSLLSSLSPYYDLIVNSTGSTYTLNGAIDVDHDLTLTAGILDVNTTPNNITVGGSWNDAGAGQLTERNGLVIVDGNGTLSANEAFYGLRVATAGTVTLGANLDVDNNLTIQSGTLDAGATSFAITVGGNWSNSGTFTRRSGTVTFDDVTKTSTVAGNTTFHNFTSTTPAKAITVTAASTQTIANALTLTGTSGNLITLRSSVTDTRWNIIVNGTSAVTYVDVKDSDASGGNAIDTGNNSTNNGNNLNWIFNAAPTAATTLYSNDTATTAQSGLVSPTNLTDETPNFSAIYNDPDAGDIANKYCIQVNSANDFNGTNLWYSDSSSCNTGSTITNITAGQRSADKEYAGSVLSCNTTYYWRIRFSDDSNAIGAWSTAADFLINCAPSVSDAAGSVNEDTTYNGDLSHTDGDPDAVTYSVVSGATNGTVNITNTGTGAFTYIPNANVNGSDSFTYKVNDGTENSNTATFTITVNAINDVPSFTKGVNQTVLEDAGAQTATSWATNISSGPSNESGQSLTFNVSNDNNALFSSQPSVNTTTGNLIYTPAANANGTATITVSLSDNGGTANSGVDTSASQTFTITVNAVNDTPSFTKGADQTVNEDAGAQSVTGWSTAVSTGPSDESSQTVNYLVSADNTSLFAVQPAVASNGQLTYTSAANANGSATVSVRIQDNGGTSNGGTDTSAAQTFTITVNAVNDAPSFTKGSDKSLTEDSGVQTFTAWASAISSGPSNESGQTLTFDVSNSNTGLFSAQPAIASNGQLTFTPGANANGSATVTVRLNDNGGIANNGSDTSAAQTFTITITAVNDTPVANAGSDIIILESDTSTASGSLDGSLSTDADGSTLAYAWVEVTDSADGCSLSNATTSQPTVTVENRDSNYSCTYQLYVNDGTTDSTADTVIVSVTADNDAPTLTTVSDKTVDANTTLTFSVAANDLDTTTLALSAADSAGNFSANDVNVDDLFTDNGNNTGTFSWEPDTSDVGDYQLTLAAADSATTTTEIVAVAVTSSNQAPQLITQPDDIAMQAGQTLSNIFDLNDYFSDPDGDSLTYTASGQRHITVTITAGEVSITAPDDFTGTDAVIFTATDPGSAALSTAAVVVTVASTNPSLDEVDHLAGSARGAGVVTVIAEDGSTLAEFTAFEYGGVIPRLVTVNDTGYVFAIKRTPGSTMRIFTLSGKTVVKQRLSPNIHWRRFDVGELDHRTATAEIATGIKRAGSVHVKIFRYRARTKRLVLYARAVYYHVGGDYAVSVEQGRLVLRNEQDEVLTSWKPTPTIGSAKIQLNER